MQVTKPIVAERIEALEEELVIVLKSREIRIPWGSCSPRLAAASTEQRRSAELSPGGYGIHWPMIDEDLSISGLALGFRPALLRQERAARERPDLLHECPPAHHRDKTTLASSAMASSSHTRARVS